jgi:hypothetical protein
MFAEIGVEAGWKFDDALRNIRSDSRYPLLKMPMRLQKSTFASYLDDLKMQKRRHAEKKLKA